jgi:hypothetical protein
MFPIIMEFSVEPRLKPKLAPVPGRTPKRFLKFLKLLTLQVPIEIEIKQFLKVGLVHEPTPSPVMRWRIQSRNKARARDSVA